MTGSVAVVASGVDRIALRRHDRPPFRRNEADDGELTPQHLAAIRKAEPRRRLKGELVAGTNATVDKLINALGSAFRARNPVS